MNPRCVSPQAEKDASVAGTVRLFYPNLGNFGGEERVLLAKCRALTRLGIDHEVVCYQQGFDLNAFATSPVRIVELAPGASPVRRIRALSRYFRSCRWDERSAPLLIGLQAVFHAGLSGLRRPYNARIADTPSLLSPPPPPSNRILQGVSAMRQTANHAVTGHVLRRARTVIMNARYFQDEMLSLYGVGCETAYIGGKYPSAEGIIPIARRRLGAARILSVCRLEPNKRIDWLLEACVLLKDSFDIELDIVGTGSLEGALRARAQQSGLGERVRFHGFLPDEDVERLYAGATLFAMPGWQGYGIPALEALYRSIPVVLHRDNGVQEILSNTPWAEVYEGGIEETASALESMLVRIGEGALDARTPSDLPTEDSFGEEIVRLCGWAQ